MIKTNTMISIIAAIAENGAIGKDNRLLWHISEDLKFFKAKTTGHSVVMGRRTYESFGGRALPKRRNIVISPSSGPAHVDANGAEFYPSLSEALQSAVGEEEVFIIGGGMLYRSAMDLAQRLYITHVATTIEDADTFFPAIEASQWQILEESELKTDPETDFRFRFVTYGRK